MTLEEIFKTNPELLKAPEVQALIKHQETQHHRAYTLIQNMQTKQQRITEAVFRSDQFLINGTPSSEIVCQIIDLI